LFALYIPYLDTLTVRYKANNGWSGAQFGIIAKDVSPTGTHLILKFPEGFSIINIEKKYLETDSLN
jgi:hypothetical protein